MPSSLGLDKKKMNDCKYFFFLMRHFLFFSFFEERIKGGVKGGFCSVWYLIQLLRT